MSRRRPPAGQVSGDATAPRILAASMVREARNALISAPEHAVLVSPYLTLPAAQQIIGAADAASAIVLTTFDAEAFVAGASSLGAIRKLMQAGYTLHALPGLHAKIIIAGTTVFCGSQNFTRGGTTNREATAVIHAAEIAADLRAQITAWLPAADTITADMVSDMERLIRPVSKVASEIRSRAAQADWAVRAAESARREERRGQEEAERRQREEEERTLAGREQQALAYDAPLRRAVRRAAVVGQPVALRRAWTLGRPGARSATLQAPQATSLLEWTDWNGSTTLIKRHRYLVAVPERGRLGWGAWNATQLSRFATDIEFPSFSWRGHDWKLLIDFNQDQTTLPAWNVSLSFQRLDGRIRLDAQATFLLPGFRVHQCSWAASSSEWQDDAAYLCICLELDVQSSDSDCCAMLEAHILAPFRFKRNGRGRPAEEFTTDLGDRSMLRLHTLGDKMFFSLQSE